MSKFVISEVWIKLALNTEESTDKLQKRWWPPDDLHLNRRECFGFIWNGGGSRCTQRKKLGMHVYFTQEIQNRNSNRKLVNCEADVLTTSPPLAVCAKTDEDSGHIFYAFSAPPPSLCSPSFNLPRTSPKVSLRPDIQIWRVKSYTGR